jgi:hypothetical protein
LYLLQVPPALSSAVQSIPETRVDKKGLSTQGHENVTSRLKDTSEEVISKNID